MCVCVCVIVRERDREKEDGKNGERKGDKWWILILCGSVVDPEGTKRGGV